jgi:2-succinyl-5-enolpyruvyl-6-hydroxy-3-cyclohexene-1-carboxylate synthase
MKLNDAPNLNYAWAMLMVEELVRNDVTCFCIAPGSRSSPLTAAAANHPGARTIVHYDERGLAFFALGHAAASKQPAVLICSSGTAAANFFPAVIETSKKKLPLILLTADRPPELQNTGALQTIDQTKIYGDYARWFTCLPPPTEDIKPEMVLTTIDQAVFRAKDPMPGPVHINCMFREPLAPDKNNFDAAAYLSSLADWTGKTTAYTRWTTGQVHSDVSSDDSLKDIINNTRRGIIVVGKLGSKAEQEAVPRLAEKIQWPVFPDIVSGLRFHPHESIIHYYDQVLLSNAFSKKYPIDTVLHLGGRITSKRWQQYVETQRPKNYITVLAHSLRNDPMHLVSIRVKARIIDFIQSLLPSLKSNTNNDHLRFLQAASKKAGGMIEGFSDSTERIDEISTARSIIKTIGNRQGLFLSNSMPVREMDMYAPPIDKEIFIGGNRGASGIDGIIASACGFAHGLNATTTLLIGDLAFLHDLNSLALVSCLRRPFGESLFEKSSAKTFANSNLVIVVINNNGGGIFSFLPIARSPLASDIFEPYFGTPHGLEFSNAARMFGLDYAAPTTVREFEEVYANALKAKKTFIIEVKTKRDENFFLHREWREKIEIEIDKMVK